MFWFIILISFADLGFAQHTVPEEDSCDLPWALDCIDDLMVKLRTPNLPLEYYCSSTNYTINVCLNDILTAEDCITKYPRHGYYHDWRKPLNAAMLRFCSMDQDYFEKLRQAAHCTHQSFFTCLHHDLNMVGPLGILEAITAQMVPETCSGLDLTVEQCLQYDNAPECRLFVDTTLGLVQEFIESASCKEQPAILVPLNTDNSNDRISEGKGCAEELELDVLSKCFDPMLDRADNGQMSQELHWFCQSTNETYDCLVDLLINGCGASLPQAYSDWLDVLGTMEQGFCSSPNDISLLHNCWKDYYECFQTSKGFLVLADIFFNQITTDTCMGLVDEMESCLLSTEFECHDRLSDIINTLRTQFTQNSLCGNSHKLKFPVATNSKNLFEALPILIATQIMLSIGMTVI